MKCWAYRAMPLFLSGLAKQGNKLIKKVIPICLLLYLFQTKQLSMLTKKLEYNVTSFAK